jgi:hypothetical protein
VPEAAYRAIQLTSLCELMAQATNLPSSPKRILGAPHLAKNERDAPNFLPCGIGTRSACAPFFKEKAHEDRGSHEASQEIGDVAHPSFVGRKESVKKEIGLGTKIPKML